MHPKVGLENFKDLMERRIQEVLKIGTLKNIKI
jgi:hypothetical protein